MKNSRFPKDSFGICKKIFFFIPETVKTTLLILIIESIQLENITANIDIFEVMQSIIL